MSQAANLLNSLAETTSAYSDSEPVIVIGDDRFITVPDSLKRIAVQYDHDIETVTFNGPRYWDEHDMSQMKIYINYMLPNGTTDQYVAQNVAVKGQRMTFDWTISGNVTQYKGNLSFLVCIKRTDDEGYEERHWNSELNRDLYISEGLECAQNPVYRYPDIITQLLLRMDEVEAIATPEAMQAYTDTWLEENHDRILAEIEAKGAETLATIPEEYTTVATWADEGAHKKANAIELETTGESIFIDDSADAYLLGLNLYGKTTQIQTTGKNLLNYEQWKTVTISNGTAVWADNGVTLTATSDDCFTGYAPSSAFPQIAVSEGDIVTASWEFSGTAETATVFIFGDGLAESKKSVNGAANNSVSYTVPAGITFISFRVGVAASGKTATFKNVQIEIGETATDYEPYSGGVASPSPEWPQDLVTIENPSIDIYGKNLVSSVLVGTASTQYSNCLLVGMDRFEPDTTYTISFVAANGHKMYLNENLFSYQYVTGTGRRQSITATTKSVVDSSKESQYTSNHWIILKNSEGNTVSPAFTDVQIEVGFTCTDYMAHVDVQNIAASYDLPGIPVASGGNYTDSNGQQWVCDEIDFERGVYVQRIRTLILTGDENITRANDTSWAEGCYVVYTKTNNPEHVHGEIMCSFLPNRSNADLADGKYEFGIGTHGQPNLIFKFGSNVNTLELAMEAWANAIASGGHVNVILATPIETPLTAEEIANFKMVRSHYHNTTVLNDSGAHMVVTYAADTKMYIDEHTVSEESVQAAVDAYLEAHFSNAEEVSF